MSDVVITRIQFGRERVTIYDTDGVFAMWDGRRALELALFVTEKIAQLCGGNVVSDQEVELDAVRAVLQRIEWSGGHEYIRCPECDGVDPARGEGDWPSSLIGHREGCALAQVLRRKVQPPYRPRIVRP